MSDITDFVPNLPPVARHITSHNLQGQSIHISAPPQRYVNIPGTGGFARSYSVTAVPANLQDDKDLSDYTRDEGVASWSSPAIVTPSGVNLMIVDLEPGGSSAMHQTVSIDFSVCVLGQIDHELDSGEKVRLNPGDHIVQRGTMHRWINASQSEPARLLATTISCVPFDVAGEKLREIHLPA